ncbi:MAG TPA: hypothetical protein VHX44_10010, partial [Planctomycetota bacterium]|nr:hypothetical protein [Planctomycetota bacterium]
GTGTASLVIDIQPEIEAPPGGSSSSSSEGDGGSGGCGLGATSAIVMLLGLWLIAALRWRP